MRFFVMFLILISLSQFAFAAKVRKVTSSRLYLTFTSTELQRFTKGDSVELSSDDISITGDILKITGKSTVTVDCDDPEVFNKGDIVQVYMHDEVEEDDDSEDDVSYEYHEDSDSSAAQREDKMLSLNLVGGGIFQTLHDSRGFEIGTFIHPDELIHFGHQSGEEYESFIASTDHGRT